METWSLITLLTTLILSGTLLRLLFPSKKPPLLPPGPPSIPLIGNLLWLRHSPSLSTIQTLLKTLSSHLGPILTLRFGSTLSIFITDPSLAHQALVALGSSFSSRPPPPPFSRFAHARISTISSSPYGHQWRLLRRNLTSQILHPAKIRLFAPARRWVLALLINDLQTKSQQSPQQDVVAIDSFELAMFSLLVFMCFGEKLDQKMIGEIQSAQRELLLFSSRKLRVFSFFPKLVARVLFQGRLRTLARLRKRQSELFVPLIRARRENRKKEGEERFVYSYLDSLFEIEEGGSQLTEEEIIPLCSEFLVAGTDTTATALQWTMAELVARRDVQAKLVEEIKDAEFELQSSPLPYLKAVVLEGLRRHPPAHFVLPHSASEDVEFEGYVIPKNASVNFTVAEFGWDEKVWREPMEFRPERFVEGGEGEGVDITGSREIKMMPFGVGRRICPGLGLAMLHLEYFVGNLVREFQWDAVEGEEIDFSEATEFVVVMKKPLRARITPRKMVS